MTKCEQPLFAVTASPQDAYPPTQIARLVGDVGVRKATKRALVTLHPDDKIEIFEAR